MRQRLFWFCLLLVLLTSTIACSSAKAGTSSTDSTSTSATSTAPVIIAGMVNADGTVHTGTGFASSVSQGNYTLTFATGTFSGTTPPTVVLTPFYSGGNPMNFGSYTTTYPGDGSATITFNFDPSGGNNGNQVPFTFIATNGQ